MGHSGLKVSEWCDFSSLKAQAWDTYLKHVHCEMFHLCIAYTLTPLCAELDAS